MHSSTSNDQSINAVDYEQSKNINLVPETHTTEPDLPVIPDGPVPPPYNDNDKPTAPMANNSPYPGYDPSRIRIAVTPLERLGEAPAHINCPFCNTISLTTVQKSDSSQTTYFPPPLFSWLSSILFTKLTMEQDRGDSMLSMLWHTHRLSPQLFGMVSEHRAQMREL
ncbi:hypothetical protein F66182_18316 [Fusarium sp. NRRL 66182]|nr:hypothetical protein F66182_18316 [Fusarium sp. NRRL 66182]